MVAEGRLSPVFPISPQPEIGKTYLWKQTERGNQKTKLLKLETRNRKNLSLETNRNRITYLMTRKLKLKPTGKTYLGINKLKMKLTLETKTKIEIS